MTQEDLVAKTRAFVEDTLGADKTGHDWWHVVRVVNLARHIAKAEKGADMFVVELGALLHDIADWKFNGGDTTAGPRAARAWLKSLNAEPDSIERVAYIVEHISFRGGTNKHAMQTIEGKIVQDADRLDAIGAIGIARTFTFGGARGRAMHEPGSKPQAHMSFDSYQKQIANSTTIHHFYEKLLLLKDGMHTATARRLAAHRHQFLETFLDEFYKEWEGER